MLLKLQVEPGKINSLTLFRSCLYRGSSFLLDKMSIHPLSISQIPEPATASLAFLGLGGLLTRRRRH